MQKRSKFLINIELRLEHNMFCGGAVALYSLVGSDPLAHTPRTKLLGHDSKPPPAASSDLAEYIATRVWFRAKCCFHVFCAYQGSWFLLSFGSQLDPKFWFFPGLYNYAIVYVASIFGFEDLTVKFLEIDEYLNGSGFSGKIRGRMASLFSL